jgi:hypothetical protein
MRETDRERERERKGGREERRLFRNKLKLTRLHGNYSNVQINIKYLVLA